VTTIDTALRIEALADRGLSFAQYNAILDAADKAGVAGALQKLAWHTSVEACAGSLSEVVTDVLLNKLLDATGEQATLGEIAEVIRKQSRSIDYDFEFQAGLA
jgi:hypothetical protein